MICTEHHCVVYSCYCKPKTIHKQSLLIKYVLCNIQVLPLPGSHADPMGAILSLQTGTNIKQANQSEVRNLDLCIAS